MIFCPQFANSPRNFCHLRQLTECNIHPTPYTTFNTLFTFSCSAMLRHSRWAGHRAGDFHAKISGQDMPVKTQGAGFYESAQDFSLFYFFLFLRCLSGYLFFAENHIKFWIITRFFSFLLFSFFEMPFRVFIFCGESYKILDNH